MDIYIYIMDMNVVMEAIYLYIIYIYMYIIYLLYIQYHTHHQQSLYMCIHTCGPENTGVYPQFMVILVKQLRSILDIFRTFDP